MSVSAFASLCIFLCLTLALHLLGFVRHLQEANDTLKAEVKRLKEVADERERDTECFKVNKCRVEKKSNVQTGRQKRVNH